MKVKVENGKVEFLLKAGTHLVKNYTTDIKLVQKMIDTGEVTDSEIEGYDIVVKTRYGNETYYFKVEKPKQRKKVTDEKTIQ